MEKETFEKESGENRNEEGTLVQSEQSQKTSMKQELFEWVQAIVIALVIALVIRTFVFSLIKVNGQSMLPTLHHDDRLVVVKLMYEPKQGDIIILNPPDKQKGPFVKRIIATSGQNVDIDYEKHKVYVDGEVLQEDYVNELVMQRGDIQFPVTVPEDHVFVLGDNRNNSRDSRYSDVGMIPYQFIIGKVTLKIWPLHKFGSVYE
ncbi:MAG: signal peptidase I [Firmicutes bacterium]|nr:signal peptidase I [Bacillota bacterium]